MKLIYKDEKCVMIKFNETQKELRELGWLGDEDEARIFKADALNKEVRIFKKNGESYVLTQDSKDPMVRLKFKTIITFANQN